MIAWVGALVPWLLGAGWGLIVVGPLVGWRRRRRLVARASRLGERSGSQPTTRSRIRLLDAGRRATGPVGRVVAGLVHRRRAQRQGELLARDLPVTIDVLSVAVAAGCTPFLAVGAAARWAPSAVAEHCAEVIRATELGAGFGDALDDLGERTPMLRPLANALLISDRTGAPVAPALERLAAEQRSGLRRRAEERARKVPVRLLFPLVFLVLPAFGLLTVAPALLAGFDRS